MDTIQTVRNSLIVVICAFVMIVAIAIFMSDHAQPVDPTIRHLVVPQNQPFGGGNYDPYNKPEIHPA